MIDADQIRIHQEQRLASARRALNEAKDHLAAAMALFEIREQEYRGIQEDIKQKLAALDIVISMASEPDDQADRARPKTREQQGVAENARREATTSAELEDSGKTSTANKSFIPTRVIIRWRPLFPLRNSEDSRRSNLQSD